MNLPKFLLYPLGFLVLSTGIVWAAQLTMSTYYPSPSGNYKNLTVGSNFGIGTTSPTAAFEVVGSGSAFPNTSGVAQSAGLIFRLHDSSNLMLDIGGFGVNGIWLQSTDKTNLALDYPLLLNPNGGNVGIGNTNPTYPLTVKNVIALGAALNNTTSLFTLQNTNSNFNVLNFSQIRTAAGGSWTTATTRIQNVTDVSAQSYMDFNPVNGSNAIAFGNNATEYMRIASGGNVGIGVTVPAEKFHVKGPSGVTVFTGLTPLGVLIGGSLTTNDYSGIDFTGNSNITPLARIGVVSTGIGTYMRFGTSSSYVSGVNNTAMTIDPVGNVGIGVATPTSQFQVNDAAGYYTQLGSTTLGVSTNGTIQSINSNIGTWNGIFESAPYLTSGSPYGIFVSNGQNVYSEIAYSIYGLITSGMIYTTSSVQAVSDKRLKQNIVPLTGTLSKLDQLRGVSFEWNHLSTSMGHKEGEKGIGLIAQELQKVYPELVKGSPKNQGHQYLSIDYEKFTAVLLQSIKELKSQMITIQDEIKEQLKEITDQQKEIKELKKKLTRE
jgi:hypothetical protein